MKTLVLLSTILLVQVFGVQSMKYKTTVRFLGEDGKTLQEVEIDPRAKTEVMVLPGDGDDADKGLLVLDYKKRVLGIFLPKTNKCYVSGGLDERTSPFKDAPSGEDEQEIPADDEDDKTRTNLVISDDQPLETLSVLPDALKSVCEGKDTFWMREETVANRHRRGLCDCIKSVSYCCRWRWFRCTKKCTSCILRLPFC